MQDILQLLSDIYYFLFPAPDPYVNQAIPLIIPLAAMAISAGSTIYGESKKAKEAKRMRAANDEAIAKQNALNAKRQDIADWYNAEASKDFMDTEVAKSTLGKIREQYKKGVQTNASNEARGGATAEAEVANKTALHGKYNKVMNNMVGYGTQYKNSMKQGYANMLGSIGSGIDNVANRTMGMHQTNLNSWSNMADNAGSTFSNTAGSTDWAAYFDDDELKAGGAIAGNIG